MSHPGLANGFDEADVEDESRRHPQTFFIPPLERRRSLDSGDSARLVFRFSPRGDDDPSAERMWVRVAGADEHGYAGYLANEPFAIEGLHAGAVIAFKPRHVASLEAGDEELGFNIDERAFVSKRVAAGDWPGSVVREPPEGRLPRKTSLDGQELVDSGWQVLSGDETEEELEGADAAVLWDLGWLSDKFPSLRSLFGSGRQAGGWLWDSDTNSYLELAPSE